MASIAIRPKWWRSFAGEKGSEVDGWNEQPCFGCGHVAEAPTSAAIDDVDQVEVATLPWDSARAGGRAADPRQMESETAHVAPAMATEMALPAQMKWS